MVWECDLNCVKGNDAVVQFWSVVIGVVSGMLSYAITYVGTEHSKTN